MVKPIRHNRSIKDQLIQILKQDIINWHKFEGLYKELRG